MFLYSVAIILMVLLIIATGASLHMGVFKSHKPETAFGVKAVGGVISYGLSAVFWFFSYSHHYLGW